MKTIFIDVETTGTNPQKHGIWQIGCIAVDEKEQVLGTFTDVMIPPKDVEWDKYVLDNMLPESYKEKVKENRVASSSSVFSTFIKWLDLHVNKYNIEDKFRFIAYNAKFDWDFTYAWAESHKFKYLGSYFFFPPFPVDVFASYLIGNYRGKMKKFNLQAVCQHFGIGFVEDEAHDAFYDIKKTQELWKYTQKWLKIHTDLPRQ